MTQRHFDTLDGLRGVAAVLVVLFHAPWAAIRPAGGYLAVDLFFGLSGFVLAHAYEDDLKAAGRVLGFMIKRLVRLYPLYLFGLVLGFAAYVIGAALGDGFWPTAAAVSLGSNILMLPTPSPSLSVVSFRLFPFNSPSWSLFFEMAVNLAFAGLAPYLRRPWVFGLIAVAGCALVYSALARDSVGGGWNHETLWVGAARVTFSFFVGIVIHDLWVAGRLRQHIPGWLSCAALVAILMAPVPEPAKALVGLCAILVLFPSLLALSTGPSSSSLMARLGRLSYPLYMVHVPVLALLEVASHHVFHHSFGEFGPVGSIFYVASAIGLAVAADPIDLLIRRRLTTIFRDRLSPSGASGSRI